MKRNAIKGLITTVLIALLAIGTFLLYKNFFDTGREYKNGCIKIVNGKTTIELNDVLIEKGHEENFLDGINVVIDTSYTVEVDMSQLNIYEPGEYEIIYNISAGGVEKTGKQKVIVRNKQKTKEQEKKENLEKVIESSEIELSNGSKALIRCTNKRYIEQTKTVERHRNRKNRKVIQSDLIVIFNTGEEMVLESIEKNID